MPCWRRRACRLPAWAALCYLTLTLLLLCPHRAQSHVDNCNWKGSGLTDTLIAPGTASIVQLSLHCGQGSLEWLYPSGALRVLLHAPAAMARGGRLVVCLKPLPGSHGANVYVERPGELQLVVDEASGASDRVYCVPAGHGERDDGGAATALFIQAVPQTDISRKVTALRYELRPEGAQVVVPGRDAGDPDGVFNRAARKAYAPQHFCTGPLRAETCACVSGCSEAHCCALPLTRGQVARLLLPCHGEAHCCALPLTRGQVARLLLPCHGHVLLRAPLQWAAFDSLCEQQWMTKREGLIIYCSCIPLQQKPHATRAIRVGTPFTPPLSLDQARISSELPCLLFLPEQCKEYCGFTPPPPPLSCRLAGCTANYEFLN
ncbi:uncharacterized protein LOC144934606 isoform X1 [Lampetra fluviatilis]